ncbi:hypothetical protein DXT94_27195 [Rhizobium sp. ICMP 5592]|nr:hypothetical protein [Rhizobium sp. ICMP 5592]
MCSCGWCRSVEYAVAAPLCMAPLPASGEWEPILPNTMPIKVERSDSSHGRPFSPHCGEKARMRGQAKSYE